MDSVENVVGGKPQVQGTRFLDGDRFIECHVERDLARTFNNVTSRIPESRAVGINARGAGRAKRGSIEPFERRGIIQRNSLPRDGVGAQRSAHAAANVQRSTKHARGKVKSGTNREVSAPLPRTEDMPQRALCHEVAVLSNRQIVNPVDRKSTRLNS